MYNIIYETSRQFRFDARYWMLGAGALGQPRGMVWGGRREEGSGWGTHVCLWWIHFDIWQNQYNIVKFKNKIKFKKITSEHFSSAHSVAQLCPTLQDPMDCSLPGFSLHGIFQARVLECVAINGGRGQQNNHFIELNHIELMEKVFTIILILSTTHLFFKIYFIFKLYNIVLVLPYIEMNPPQAYMCSPS